jgi:tetratricopeptide (TPR) repeat protein
MKKVSLILFVVLFLSLSVTAQSRAEKAVERARKLNADKKIAESYNEINRAIALEPGNPELYLTRAEFYFRDDNNPEVLNDARKAASLAPTDRKILYFSALILHRSRQYAEALKISDQIMTLGEVELRAWHLRVQLKTYLEDFFGAFEDASSGSEQYPDDDFLKQNQANLVRLLGNGEKALEMYDLLVADAEKKLARAVDENAKYKAKRALSMYLFSRAGINFTKFLRERALADLIRAVEYLPEGVSYFMRAKMYRQQKMFQEAIADLTTALEFKNGVDKLQIYVERGDVYAFMEKFDEAHRDYEEALKIDAEIRPLFDARIAWLNKLRAKNSK